MINLCCIYGCDNKIKVCGLCAKHYQRMRKHDDVCVNFNAYYNWRKKESKSETIKEETYHLSLEEINLMRSIFGENISIDGHTYYFNPIPFSSIDYAHDYKFWVTGELWNDGR